MTAKFQQSYGEDIAQTFDELEKFTKKLCSFVIQQRDARVKTTLVCDKDAILALAEAIRAREARLEKLLAKSDEFIARSNEIRKLQAESAAYDDKIDRALITLKDAETMMIDSVFYANEKLKSIRQARARPVDIDTLIASAHKMAIANSASAPLEWKPGDAMRPYPNENDMRQGWLGVIGQQYQRTRMSSDNATMMDQYNPNAPMLRAPGVSQWQRMTSSPLNRPPFPGALMLPGQPASPHLMQQRAAFPAASIPGPSNSPQTISSNVRMPFPSAQSNVPPPPFPAAGTTLGHPQTASPGSLLRPQRHLTLPNLLPGRPQLSDTPKGEGERKRRLSESSSSSSSANND